MTIETEYRPSEADIKPFKRNWLKYQFFRSLVKLFPANAEVIGLENIEEVRNLLADGQIVTALGNHKSIADTYDIFSAAIGYKFEDLTKRTGFTMSVAYTRGPLKHILNNVVDFIDIVPHTKSNYPKRKEVNASARFRAQNRKPGTILEIMPEGERIEGRMGKAQRGASNFWHGENDSTDNRWLLPAAVQLTEIQWPMDRGIKGAVNFVFGGGRLLPARLIFGKPVRVKYIDKAAESYATEMDKYSQNLGAVDPEKMKDLRVDLVMLIITKLQLDNKGEEYVSADYLKLTEELKIHPLSQALNKLGYFGSPQKQGV